MFENMHKLLYSFLLLLFFAVSLNAQVVVDLSSYNRNRNIDLRMSLQDAKTKEPISYATVYLVPQNDTTITNFAISNEKGEVEIKDVISGWYQVNAEMIGYKPYQKVHNLNSQNNLGTIELEENPEYIDAASITAIGNAITVQGDTLVYNASSFRVGENAMLEDLLKKMPGMEVGSDGTVMVNGEQVDKITIGGKTFFFNDPAMAVKNLPAKVVEKIKVVDKKKDEAEFTGVGTKDEKEKVMDLELKEQYKKGWFGNAQLSGGASIHEKAQDEMSGASKALFNANAMASGFNELDQITIIANGKNANEPGNGTLIYYSATDEIDEFAEREGLTTSAQAGANYNTERIKGMETSANIAYTYSQKDAREKSARTSFQPDGIDIISDGGYQGFGKDNRVSSTFYIKNKKTDKYLFTINPTFSYAVKDRNESKNSITQRDGNVLNSSNSLSASHTNVFNTRTNWNLGIKNLGKARRSLTFGGNFSYRDKGGTSTDYSETAFGSSSETRNLLYDNKTNYLATEGVLSYVEPFGDNWALQTRFTACYITQTDDKAAFNGADRSVNDYYSSFSNNKDMLFRERLLAQYEKEKTKVVFGLQIDQENNEIFSRSLGIENTAGKGEWALNFAPYADVEWSKNSNTLTMSAGGSTDTPMGSVIVPALNIANPVQITAGNVYLKTGFQQNVSIGFKRNNPKTFSYFSTRIRGTLSQNGTVYASWFDEDGVRYAIPVNSKAPGYSIFSSFDYRLPLNKEKTLTLTLGPVIKYSRRTSYQAKDRLPGLDKEHFDYSKTMAWFWGNSDGDLFYSGKSGFAESLNSTLDYAFEADLEYEIGDFDISVGGYAGNIISKYSFDKTANNNTWDFTAYGEILWFNENGWEVQSDFVLNFYRGYSEGYNKPEYLWNAKVSKAIKAFTLSLAVSDILNQEKSLLRQNTAEYMEDVYHTVMGRYFLLGVSFNFGKMNARNNSKAQSAIMQMGY